MIVAIQQPEHLPWLGFFDKMARADVFVLLDNVQFKRRYFENRNKIRSPEGYRWVTVAVKSKGRYRQLINEVELEEARSWKKKYWGSIAHAYAQAPCFGEYGGRFEQAVARDWTRLVELNVALLDVIRGVLGISTPMPLASRTVDGRETGSDLILAICRALGASTYISGPDGARYLDLDRFADAGIDVQFHEYRHPEYAQLHAPFVSHLSVIDLIFNHGEDSLRILRN